LVDWYTVDKKKVAEAKEQNMEWLRQFCHDEEMAWPQKKDLNNVERKKGYEKSGIGINRKLQSHLSNLGTVGTHL
jgi:hypothetical protein